MSGGNQSYKMLNFSSIEKKIDTSVDIHIKGFSLARVIHLDIKSEELNKILKPKEEFFFISRIRGKTINNSKQRLQSFNYPMVAKSL
jgi:hypothetical protein